MKLKCIDGPFDGQYEDVYDDLKVGNAWKVRERAKISSFDPFNVDYKPTIPYHVYIIDLFGFHKDRWMYLRYEKTTMKEIFNKVFT